jgi:NAD(P)-dependent dehydrogenase (short-subunit alcohol dehydrogenase family)
MDIKDSVVLVTGANRGLGRALVGELLARGARKVYAAARVAESVTEHDPRVVPIALDVTKPSEVEAAAKKAGDVTLLVNNAGVLASFSLLSATPEDLARDFATNAFGMLALTRAFVPTLAKTRGAVANVLTVVSFASMPGLGGYSASKAAAFSITQALRAELSTKGIAVHAVFPGPIDTDMIRSFEMTKTSAADVARAMLDGIARGDEDIAPDATSRSFFETWKKDPKALERQLAAM